MILLGGSGVWIVSTADVSSCEWRLWICPSAICTGESKNISQSCILGRVTRGWRVLGPKCHLFGKYPSFIKLSLPLPPSVLSGSMLWKHHTWQSSALRNANEEARRVAIWWLLYQTAKVEYSLLRVKKAGKVASRSEESQSSRIRRRLLNGLLQVFVPMVLLL